MLLVLGHGWWWFVVIVDGGDEGGTGAVVNIKD